MACVALLKSNLRSGSILRSRFRVLRTDYEVRVMLPRCGYENSQFLRHYCGKLLRIIPDRTRRMAFPAKRNWVEVRLWDNGSMRDQARLYARRYIEWRTQESLISISSICLERFFYTRRSSVVIERTIILYAVSTQLSYNSAVKSIFFDQAANSAMIPILLHATKYYVNYSIVWKYIAINKTNIKLAITNQNCLVIILVAMTNDLHLQPS